MILQIKFNSKKILTKKNQKLYKMHLKMNLIYVKIISWEPNKKKFPKLLNKLRFIKKKNYLKNYLFNMENWFVYIALFFNFFFIIFNFFLLF